MTDEVISTELREFIVKYLDSIAHLEILLLFRASPSIFWTVADTAKRLYTTEQQAAEVLERLHADKLISRHGSTFTYGDHDEQATQIIDRLADVYSRHLIPVTNLIHDKPRRIREFADAFKFKKGR
jgi:hypothetical protein